MRLQLENVALRVGPHVHIHPMDVAVAPGPWTERFGRVPASVLARG